VGKKREKKFSKNTRIGYPKIVEKKIVSKKSEKMFFNKHMNIEIINGGKKSEKNFFQKHTYIARKNDGKKSSGKSTKTRFL